VSAQDVQRVALTATTVRDAAHREYKVIVLADANAAMPYPDMGFGAVSAQDVQRVALTAMAYEFAEVMDTAGLIARLGAAVSCER